MGCAAASNQARCALDGVICMQPFRIRTDKLLLLPYLAGCLLFLVHLFSLSFVVFDTVLKCTYSRVVDDLRSLMTKVDVLNDQFNWVWETARLRPVSDSARGAWLVQASTFRCPLAAYHPKLSTAIFFLRGKGGRQTLLPRTCIWSNQEASRRPLTRRPDHSR